MCGGMCPPGFLACTKVSHQQRGFASGFHNITGLYTWSLASVTLISHNATTLRNKKSGRNLDCMPVCTLSKIASRRGTKQTAEGSGERSRYVQIKCGPRKTETIPHYADCEVQLQICTDVLRHERHTMSLPRSAAGSKIAEWIRKSHDTDMELTCIVFPRILSSGTKSEGCDCIQAMLDVHAWSNWNKTERESLTR